MILTKRKFVREAPLRTAKSIYIFCEGIKREYQYFDFFKEMDSRINVEVYKLDPHEDNSPLGLLNIAKSSIISSEENPKPKYAFQKNDEVWLVLDTDKDKDQSREGQIEAIRKEVGETDYWNLAESNPCFEVWLYYHENDSIPEMENIDNCSEWKGLVNREIKGGFDSRRHPIYIIEATNNSEKVFERTENNSPAVGNTEMHLLAKSIMPLIEIKIKKVLKEL